MTFQWLLRDLYGEELVQIESIVVKIAICIIKNFFCQVLPVRAIGTSYNIVRRVVALLLHRDWNGYTH